MDELEVFEEQLEANGVATSQIHVLTLEDASAENHEHIHDVNSLMKTDVVHSWELGALVGLCLGVVILLVAHYAGWTNSSIGWYPFIFLSIVALGFSTWEGGLLGIQRPNHNFKKFQSALHSGKHVFFVDLDSEHEGILEELVNQHPQLELAGTGASTLSWILFWQKRLPPFFR
ncbi:MAG: magnesium transporter [Pseudomonadales bacterium]|nr:magnesium transporter [Pseudomonadales bacterium]